MVFDKLGLENYLDEHKKSGDCTLAFLKYRVPKAEETNVGVPPHTDKIISTILSQHDQDVNGLQIMDKNEQWHDVQYSSPHSYIFLVSDCLKVSLCNALLFLSSLFSFEKVVVHVKNRGH